MMKISTRNNMAFLLITLIVAKKITEGEENEFPTQFRSRARHKDRIVTLVGKAVIHIGDEGKFGSGIVLSGQSPD